MARTKTRTTARPPSIAAQARAARKEISELMGDTCEICGTSPRKGLVAHHLSYHEDGVHYARSYSYRHKQSPDRYAIALLEEVKAHPERFSMLCSRHHFAVERLLGTNPEKLSRLLSVVQRSMA